MDLSRRFLVFSRRSHIFPQSTGIASFVEHTFSWFGFYRRLSKDYEMLPPRTRREAMIYTAMVHLTVRRLALHAQPAGPWTRLFSHA